MKWGVIVVKYILQVTGSHPPPLITLMQERMEAMGPWVRYDMRNHFLTAELLKINNELPEEIMESLPFSESHFSKKKEYIYLGWFMVILPGASINYFDFLCRLEFLYFY